MSAAAVTSSLQKLFDFAHTSTCVHLQPRTPYTTAADIKAWLVALAPGQGRVVSTAPDGLSAWIARDAPTLQQERLLGATLRTHGTHVQCVFSDADALATAQQVKDRGVFSVVVATTTLTPGRVRVLTAALRSVGILDPGIRIVGLGDVNVGAVTATSPERLVIDRAHLAGSRGHAEWARALASGRFRSVDLVGMAQLPSPGAVGWTLEHVAQQGQYVPREVQGAVHEQVRARFEQFDWFATAFHRRCADWEAVHGPKPATDHAVQLVRRVFQSGPKGGGGKLPLLALEKLPFRDDHKTLTLYMLHKDAGGLTLEEWKFLAVYTSGVKRLEFVVWPGDTDVKDAWNTAEYVYAMTRKAKAGERSVCRV